MKYIKIIRTLFLVSIISCLLMACGSGGGGGSSNGGQGDQDDPLSFTVSPSEGGTLEITDDPALKGLTVTVPPGAVDNEVTIKISRVEDVTPADSIEIFFNDTKMALEPGRVTQAYNDNAADTYMHPFHNTLTWWLGEKESSNYMVSFEPSGTHFNKPITITVPLSVFDSSLDINSLNPSEILPVISYTGSDGEEHWEVVNSFEIRDNTLTFTINHFTVTSVLKRAAGIIWTIANIPSNFLTYASHDMPALPADLQIAEFIRRAACSGVEPRLDVSKIPNPVDLLMYLMQPTGKLGEFYWTPLRNVPYCIPGACGPAYYNRLKSLGIWNGNEEVLADWVRGKSNGSVSVHDLFEKAYTLAGGDYFQAMLLSHNVLRGDDYACGIQNEYGNRCDNTIQGKMAPLINYGDRIGMRYHLFGMMLFGFSTNLVNTIMEEVPDLVNTYIDSNLFTNVPGSITSEEAGPYKEFLTKHLAVFVEEAIVSGDLTTEPEETAVDLRGFELGADLFKNMFDGTGLSLSRTIEELKEDTSLNITSCSRWVLSIVYVNRYKQPLSYPTEVPSYFIQPQHDKESSTYTVDESKMTASYYVALEEEDKVYYDVTMTAKFTAPPAVMIPGNIVSLTVNMSKDGEVSQEAMGYEGTWEEGDKVMGFQGLHVVTPSTPGIGFWYSISTNSFITPLEVADSELVTKEELCGNNWFCTPPSWLPDALSFEYFPWASESNVERITNATYKFKVPESSPLFGTEFWVTAEIGHCFGCAVQWHYVSEDTIK